MLTTISLIQLGLGGVGRALVEQVLSTRGGQALRPSLCDRHPLSGQLPLRCSGNAHLRAAVIDCPARRRWLNDACPGDAGRE